MGDVFPEIGGEPVASFNTEERSAVITAAHAGGVGVAAHAKISTHV